MRSEDRVGTVLHLSRSSGNLILKVENEPRIGDTVLDSDGKKMGRIFDLFGPVSSPYLVVRPSVGHPEQYLGKALFLRKRRK
jgi:rRNA processing protein Gar1